MGEETLVSSTFPAAAAPSGARVPLRREVAHVAPADEGRDLTEPILRATTLVRLPDDALDQGGVGAATEAYRAETTFEGAPVHLEAGGAAVPAAVRLKGPVAWVLPSRAGLARLVVATS